MHESGNINIGGSHARFDRLKKATKKLKAALKEPIPELQSAPVGDSCTARIAFLEACSKWMKRLSAIYGWRQPRKTRFNRGSLLSILLDTEKPPLGSASELAIGSPLCDLLGEPPTSLLRPTHAFIETSAGLAPLTRIELRGSLYSIHNLLNRNGEDPPPLKDAELWYIANNATIQNSESARHWLILYKYTRRRLASSRQAAARLAEWAEEAVALATGRFQPPARLYWVGKAKQLIQRALESNSPLKLADLAKAVGKSQSAVWRQFPEYFKRKGNARGATAQAVVNRDGSVVDATRDKLPASHSRKHPTRE